MRRKNTRSSPFDGYLTDSMIRELKHKIVDPSRKTSNSAYFNVCCWNFSKRERKRKQAYNKAKSKRVVRQPHKFKVRMTSIFERGTHELSTDTIKHQLTAWLLDKGYDTCHTRPWTIGLMSCSISDIEGYDTYQMSNESDDGHDDRDDSIDHTHTGNTIANDIPVSTEMHAIQRRDAKMIDKSCETDELADQLAKMHEYDSVKQDKLWQKCVIRDVWKDYSELMLENERLKNENAELKYDIEYYEIDIKHKTSIIERLDVVIDDFNTGKIEYGYGTRNWTVMRGREV